MMVPPQPFGISPEMPLQLLGTHAHTLFVHVKFSLLVPVGQEQLLFAPQPSLIDPHAEPTPGFAGQEVGAQHVLLWQTCWAPQPQLLLPPQLLLMLPHAVPTVGFAGHDAAAQPQLFWPPQPFEILPQSEPVPGFAGQEVGAQQVAGLTEVLHTSPGVLQPQLMLAPQPLLKLPHGGPPVIGPLGTFAHVYATPVGLLHWQVPVCPGVEVEQTIPLPHRQLMAPPAPLLNPVPHSFG